MNPFCGVTLLSVLLLSFLVRKHPPALLFDALGAVEDVEEPQGGPEDNGQNPGNAACALVFGNGGFQIQVFGAAVAQGLEDIVEQVVGIDRAVGLTHHQLVLNCFVILIHHETPSVGGVQIQDAPAAGVAVIHLVQGKDGAVPVGGWFIGQQQKGEASRQKQQEKICRPQNPG